MVFYFKNNTISPPVTYIMGKDKYENDELIKWGWPEDVWFHVNKLSSAHVYARLNQGQTFDNIPQEVIDDACQLVKANSIRGQGLNEIDVVYTLWSNLKKTADMEVGKYSFFKSSEVKKVKVEKRNDVLNRLMKTMTEEYPDLRASKEKRDAEEKAKRNKTFCKQKKKEKSDEKCRKEETELRSHSSPMKSENVHDNMNGYDSEELWIAGSSDDEEYEMKGQALPVAPFDIYEVDESAIPLTSQEYLQQVIAQRARLPHIVTAAVPNLPKITNQDSVSALFPDEQISPSLLSPPQDWQQKQISNFSALRYRIEINKEEWVGKNFNKFPKTKEGWFQFLFLQTSPNLPYLSTILSMRNEIMETLIKHIIEFVLEDKITIYQSGMWLFGLLACIEVPVCITLMKKLRAFVRKCRETRDKLDSSVENNEELSTQNLFICIIGKYFGQHDLAD